MYKIFNEKIVKLPVMSYFFLTVACFIFDLIVFFVALSYLGNDYDVYSYAATLMLTLSSVWMSLDLFYIIWACSFFFKIPSPYDRMLIEAVIGFPTKIGKELGVVEEKPVKAPKGNDKKGNSASKNSGEHID